MTNDLISNFIDTFKTTSYNKNQIGHDKQLILSIISFLNNLGLPKEECETILLNIAYLNKKDINISLFLELLSKSIGYITEYEYKDIFSVVKDIHDLYKNPYNKLSIDDYLHETKENRVRKLFLSNHDRYPEKNFNKDIYQEYINSLKFSAAIYLSQKEYKELIIYIDEYKKFQDSYSPLINLKLYNKFRKNLTEKDLLFWDIFFGNEYIVSLVKHHITISEIYKKNIFTNYEEELTLNEIVQLDIFTYEEYEETKDDSFLEDLKVFQICTIYNTTSLPEFKEEKDLLLYYKKLLSNPKIIELPKLKTQSSASYIYDMN